MIDQSIKQKLRESIIEKSIPLWVVNGKESRDIDNALIELLISVIYNGHFQPKNKLDNHLAHRICEPEIRANVQAVLDLIDEQDVMRKLKE